MPLLTKPKYPVVDPDPSWGRTFTNMNVGDVGAIAGFTSMGYGVGFFGSSLKLRSANARFNCGIGLMAGIMYASLSSSQRLLGVSPNFQEVSKYGSKSNAELESFNDRQKRPNIELIDDGMPRR